MSGNYNNNVNATQRLDLAADPPAWETGPTFTSQRAFLALAATGTQLYAIGGDVNGSGVIIQTDLVESLDLSLWPGGSWTDIYDPIPQALMTNVGFCTEATGRAARSGRLAGFMGLIQTSPSSIPTSTTPLSHATTSPLAT